MSDFHRISESYGIKAVRMKTYEQLDDYASWLEDNEPCLFDIPLPEQSLLTPKIQFETQKIRPELDDLVLAKVEGVLGE